MRYRLATIDDLAACRQLLQQDARFVCSPEVGDHIVEVWRRLLGSEDFPRTSFLVWEDMRQAAKVRLQTFSVGMFVHDEVLDRALADPRPYLADRIYAQMLAGEHPALTRREIASASADGRLNMVQMHYVQRYYDPLHPQSQLLVPLGPLSWHYSNAGYRMRRIHWEVYGEPHRVNMRLWGFQTTHTFAAARPTPEHNQPFWTMLDRKDVVPSPSNAFAMWTFYPPRPTLQLSPARQRVILHALQGDTDRDIARKCGISGDAVKQSWRSIIDRVTPAITATASGGAMTELAVRGAERRRVVLEYLRQHMEELRPWQINP